MTAAPVPDERGAERRLPTGTVTFLRTDVEGSMGLARALGRDWDAVNARHLGACIEPRVDRDTAGSWSGPRATRCSRHFPEAGAAVARRDRRHRRALTGEQPGRTASRSASGWASIRGEAHLAGDDYGGFDVNRAARIAAVGHGGQIVLSETTRGPRRADACLPGIDAARPRAARAQGRAAPRAPVPARRRRACRTTSRRFATSMRTDRQPARSAHELRRT